MHGFAIQATRYKQRHGEPSPSRRTGGARQTGFTLIEQIVVIVLIGALLAVAAVFLVQPFRAFDDMRRRAELVEAADAALTLMGWELRAALPNSVRIREDGPRLALEFIPTVAGGRYRARVDGAGDGDTLDFIEPDDGFDVLGGVGLPDQAERLSVVVYNLTATGAAGNAYVGDNRAALDLAASTPEHLRLLAPHRFPFASPQQRFQVVTTAVAYVCDPATGELRRVAGYGYLGNPFAVAGERVSRFISGCAFDYDAGAGTRNGLVSIRLSLSDGGETVSLLYQVHVLNVP